MEPLFQTLAVALVPQPREVPQPGYAAASLQKIFADVGGGYESFSYVYERRGARFGNDDEDFAEIRPAQHQITARMSGADLLTAEMATEKAMSIFRCASEELEIPGYLQFAAEIIALVPVPDPEPDAGDFLENRLTGAADPSPLGDGYFASTVKYRCPASDAPGEDILEIEPFFQDMSNVFLRHQMARGAGDRPLEGFDQIEGWIEQAFSFLNTPAMTFLEERGE